MAGPYDYSINIPQPPAQNFLQSLIGIRQLQQMEDQSALQQQQAAIAQQAAAFQQQLQPLEKQKMEAAIAAAKASTAQSTTGQQATQYQLDRRKDLTRTLEWISSDRANFTPENMEKVALEFYDVAPGMLEASAKARAGVSDFVKKFGDNIAKDLTLTYFTEDPKEGQKVVNTAIKAAEADPRLQSYVPQLKALSQQYANDPGKTATLTAMGMYMLSPGVAQDMFKMVENFADIKKKQAEATETEARTEDIVAKRGQTELTEDARKIINTSMDAAVGLRSKANAAADMASRFERESKGISFEGGFGTLAEFLKNSFGMEDGISALRKEYVAFRSSEAANLLKDLRPASDTDVALVMKGFLSETADQNTIARYLRGMAKVKRYEAELNAGKSDWVEQVGSLGKTKRSSVVNDVTVPVGTNFMKYSQMLTQRLYIDDVVADYQNGRITKEQAEKFIKQAKERK